VRGLGGAGMNARWRHAKTARRGGQRLVLAVGAGFRSMPGLSSRRADNGRRRETGKTQGTAGRGKTRGAGRSRGASVLHRHSRGVEVGGGGSRRCRRVEGVRRNSSACRAQRTRLDGERRAGGRCRLREALRRLPGERSAPPVSSRPHAGRSELMKESGLLAGHLQSAIVSWR